MPQRTISPRVRCFTVVCLFSGVALGFTYAVGFVRDHWGQTSHAVLLLWLGTFLLPILAFVVERLQPLRPTVLAYIALLASFGLIDRLGGK